MTPKTFSVYIYKFIAVHCSIIIREAFFCNRWNKYKGPQPDILKIMGDLGTFNPNFPLLWAQGNPQKRRWKECKIRGDEAYIKQRNKQTAKTSKSTGNIDDVHISYFLTETEATCTGSARICTSWGPKAERSSEHKTTSLIQKESLIDNYFQMKI